MVMGRPNKDVEHVADLDAGEREKQRLRAILRTITGEQSVTDASAELGIQPARFGEIRRQSLQAAVESLAPHRPGRPSLHESDEQRRVHELEAKIRRLEDELKRANLQLQLGRVIPDVLARAAKRGARARVENFEHRPKP